MYSNVLYNILNTL